MGKNICILKPGEQRRTTTRNWDVRVTSFTKEDNRKFQVARLMVDKRKLQGRMNMPAEELLDLSGVLSVHQPGAMSTVNLTKKMLLTQKPLYLAQRLQGTQDRGTRTGSTLTQENPHLAWQGSVFYTEGPSYSTFCQMI